MPKPTVREDIKQSVKHAFYALAISLIFSTLFVITVQREQWEWGEDAIDWFKNFFNLTTDVLPGDAESIGAFSGLAAGGEWVAELSWRLLMRMHLYLLYWWHKDEIRLGAPEIEKATIYEQFGVIKNEIYPVFDAIQHENYGEARKSLNTMKVALQTLKPHYRSLYHAGKPTNPAQELEMLISEIEKQYMPQWSNCSDCIQFFRQSKTVENNTSEIFQDRCNTIRETIENQIGKLIPHYQATPPLSPSKMV